MTNDWDPPLNQLADLCAKVAFMSLDISRIEPRELSGDFKALCAEIDQGAGINILMFAHEAMTAYLQGAGELLHSMARLVEDNPPAIGPSVLARCAAEYAALAWHLADPSDTPEQRAAKARRSLQTTLNEHMKDQQIAEFRTMFDAWSSGTHIKMGAKTDAETLLKKILGNAYRNDIKETSRFVHADQFTLQQIMRISDIGHPGNRQAAWNHTLFAVWAVIFAAERVVTLRGGDADVIEVARHTFNQVADMATGQRPPEGD